MIFPQASGNETNIKLPFSFILFSNLAMIISQILLLLNSDMLSNGYFRIPAIWSAAHLFTLGWALMVAMGAMYQLVPVAFLTPIWSEKLGFIQFVITALGITWFAIALYLAPVSALIPGLLTLLGILLFIFQMVMTLRKQEKPTILTAFVGTALICLFATIFLGISMILSMKTGFLAAYYLGIFKSHLLLGLAGWFTLLIFGFSYKMVPMFSLAHGFSMGPAKYVYISYIAGLIVTITSFIINHALMLTLGLLLLFIGFSLFAWHMSMIIKKKVKKNLDKPFQFALLSIGFGVLLHLLALIFAIVNKFALAIGPIMFMYLLTWVAFSIIGYLYKIVPFLWWTHKYSKEIGKKAVPSLKEMMNERIAVPLFAFMIGAALVISFGLSWQQNVIYLIGQLLFSVCVLVFSYTVISVIKK